MNRLLLVRSASTAEDRAAIVPTTSGRSPHPCCPELDASGRAEAEALAAVVPPADRVWSSHARRAAGTALLVAGEPVRDALLAGLDHGAWSGRALREVVAGDPEAFAAWRADPTAAPHGGEPRSALRDRARALLARAGDRSGVTLAVTHGDLIRAVVATVLDAGDDALWVLEAPPASVTELSHGSGTWRVVRTGWTPALRGAASASPLVEAR